MKALWSEFRVCESGASAVEYGLVIGLVSAAIVGGLAGIMDGASTKMTEANTALEKRNDGGE